MTGFEPDSAPVPLHDSQAISVGNRVSSTFALKTFTHFYWNACNESALSVVRGGEDGIIETTTPGAYEAIKNLPMDDFAKQKIAATNKELLDERNTVKDMLK